MPSIHRRAVLAGVAALPMTRLVDPAFPQDVPAPAFSHGDVVKRARDLATTPFDKTVPALPANIAALNFDAWRDIRFKSDKPLLGAASGGFRLELFHLGHLYRRPVVINVLRDGIPAPIPYASNLFGYGHNKIEGALPVNLGFAGFRLHYPLNAPHVMDEVISFLGASYYRFLGRGQRYGLSARGLAIGAGAVENEEFPFFREFWIETPTPQGERFGSRSSRPRRPWSTSGLRCLPEARRGEFRWRRFRRCTTPARTIGARRTTIAPNYMIPTAC
jgi:glucans biosynthesis protein